MFVLKYDILIQENRGRIVETYIYDRDKYAPDFYDKKMRVLLTGFLRREEKFDSISTLIDQIKEDVRLGRMINDKMASGAFSNIDAATFAQVRSLATKPFTVSKAQDVSHWEVIPRKNVGISNFRIDIPPGRE